MAKKEKILEYIDDHNILYGKNKAKPEEVEAAIRRENIRDEKLEKKYFTEKPKPIKPKPNGVSDLSGDWSADELMDEIDPSWWLPDKKVQVEENLFEKYLQMLLDGELLPGTSFKTFERDFHQYDTETTSKIKKEINKRIAAAKKSDLDKGLAALLRASPGRLKT